MARRTPNPESDIDLLVVAHGLPVGRSRRVEEFGPLFLDMTEHVVLLHDRDGFLRRHLDRLRAELEKTGARRVPYKGAWYWDFGPGKKDGSR
ncbi:MAG TPA: hypothetical protein DHW14_09500 [Clostridiales bacterium]|nr:hypothetical protein [Clostridiales bacterium]